jgi:catechol 2,3-dioxygenase-like lactoylglutathione lyase family enzyme
MIFSSLQCVADRSCYNECSTRRNFRKPIFSRFDISNYDNIRNSGNRRSLLSKQVTKATSLRNPGNPIHHIEITVSDLGRSGRFYGGFLARLGYKEVLRERDIIGWRCRGTVVFLLKCEKRFLSAGFHRKRVGLNHVAFRVASRGHVDRFHKYLREKRTTILYGGPKDWPEYMGGYYAVYPKTRTGSSSKSFTRRVLAHREALFSKT